MVGYCHNISEAGVEKTVNASNLAKEKRNLFRNREFTVAIWVSGLDKQLLHSEAGITGKLQTKQVECPATKELMLLRT